jgi:(p)ppGpp synthase/HD superfamily hydrolase
MGSRFSPETYRRALTFAAKAHGDQKTPTGFPYLWHVSNVTMELLRALTAEPGHDEDLAVACALLHDVLEDTKTGRAEIEPKTPRCRKSAAWPTASSAFSSSPKRSRW